MARLTNKPRPGVPSRSTRVPAPWNDPLVVREVRGHTMGQLLDGWHVYYAPNDSPPADEVIGELCVVQTTDGRTLLRYVRRGRRNGAYDLLTVTGPAMLDVELVWAEKVRLIEPRRPETGEVPVLDEIGGASATEESA